jgi:APA family basic amino acid/polyamine antiporter
LGATEIDTNNWDPFFPFGFEGSFKGAGTVFFSFIGTHLTHTRARTAVTYSPQELI